VKTRCVSGDTTADADAARANKNLPLVRCCRAELARRLQEAGVADVPELVQHSK
jgi:hypothetical protein